MLRAPIIALATIPWVFGIAVWPWMTRSKALYLPLNLIEAKYKEEIVTPWLNSLTMQGERSIGGTITTSTAVAQAAVKNALVREDERYSREEKLKKSQDKDKTIEEMVVMNSNLWAAQSALLSIRSMLRESLVDA
jgi:hypothetical protein